MEVYLGSKLSYLLLEHRVIVGGTWEGSVLPHRLGFFDKYNLDSGEPLNSGHVSPPIIAFSVHLT